MEDEGLGYAEVKSGTITSSSEGLWREGENIFNGQELVLGNIQLPVWKGSKRGTPRYMLWVWIAGLPVMGPYENRNENPHWLSGDINVFGVEMKSGLSKSSILQPDSICNRRQPFFLKPHEVASIGVNVSGILICPCVEDFGRTENIKYNLLF
jgi:hypothetical protein